MMADWNPDCDIQVGLKKQQQPKTQLMGGKNVKRCASCGPPLVQTVSLHDMCAHSRPLRRPQDALANRALDRRSPLRNTNMCTETSLSDQHAAPRSPRHLSPQIVGVSPAAPDTPWHRWYSSPGGFRLQITTCPQRLFVSTLHNVSVAARSSLANRGTGDRSTPLLPLSAFCCSRVWTSRPDSCRRCHLAERMRDSSVFSSTAICVQRAPCVPCVGAEGVPKKEGAHLLCAFFFFFPLSYSHGNLLAVFRMHLITHQAPFA